MTGTKGSGTVICCCGGLSLEVGVQLTCALYFFESTALLASGVISGNLFDSHDNYDTAMFSVAALRIIVAIAAILAVRRKSTSPVFLLPLTALVIAEIAMLTASSVYFLAECWISPMRAEREHAASAATRLLGGVVYKAWTLAIVYSLFNNLRNCQLRYYKLSPLPTDISIIRQ